MSIQSLVENELIEDRGAVWQLAGHTTFGYTDGAASERYLDQVFRAASDLSTKSSELESFIKDWPSEYHLTTRRAQLLSGFTFDRSMRALEVGCGCGAITRHLAENFDQVISVEGNLNRARLARLRTRDLSTVSVICAPFQEIRFKAKFDIIFCIGVFEYSGSFVQGIDPYEEALRYFADMLTPDGIVVIAIENQFGLKYFSCAREDHIGTMFEGLEGYHRRPQKVRTFGKTELEARLRRHFECIEFYYPYPDYKVPECVLSAKFLGSGRAGELVSQMKARDYSGPMNRLWDDSATALELSRNRMLEFFSNSFIVVAGRGSLSRVTFPQQAVLFSSGRRAQFATCTRIVETTDGSLAVTKKLVSGKHESDSSMLRLVATDSPWIDATSLQTEVMLRARNRSLTLEDIFAPCKPWIARLQAEALTESGERMLPGSHVDSIWSNAYVVRTECQLIDQEWVWSKALPMNVVVIRAIYNLLTKLDTSLPVARALQGRGGRSLIRQIGASIGVDLSRADFDRFTSLETELQWLAFGVARDRHSIYLKWYLFDRTSLHAVVKLRSWIMHTGSRIAVRLGLSR